MRISIGEKAKAHMLSKGHKEMTLFLRKTGGG
jgi:hypothetical protein